MPRPMAAGVFGIARTIAVSRGSSDCRKVSDRPAMIETTTVAGPISDARLGRTSGAACGLTAMTIASARSASNLGLSRSPSDP